MPNIFIGSKQADNHIGEEPFQLGRGGADYLDASHAIGDVAMFGGRGRDNIIGGSGDDLIYGNRGRDTLTGNEGDDVLKGGRAADQLDGGAGTNTLKGGRGKDTFIFDLVKVDAVSRVKDFNPKKDNVIITKWWAGNKFTEDYEIIYDAKILSFDFDGPGPLAPIELAKFKHGGDLTLDDFF